ncbi:MAG: hypothetical protein HQK75_06280 [Candidatus Magnetomorum sp.]|nr:hypothetical protein [Candidatus Magnetomorum sp.]
MQQIQPINSWRMYGKVVENKVTVELPVSMNSQEVEIFIFPKIAKNTPYCFRQEDWKKDFLEISKWDISEEDVRLKTWQIPEF